MRISIIYFDPYAKRVINSILKSEGFIVHSMSVYGSNNFQTVQFYYDIVLLDVNKTNSFVYDVLVTLGGYEKRLPVLIVSDIFNPDMMLRCLRSGADDYITKPFHPAELVARIHAIVRRSNGHGQSVISTGKLAVDLISRTVKADGAQVHLTKMEYIIIEFLALRKGKTVSKDNFLMYIYNPIGDFELRSFYVGMFGLKKNFKPFVTM